MTKTRVPHPATERVAPPPATTARAGEHSPRPVDRLKYHAVLIALSKARAAGWLLNEAVNGCLAVSPVDRPECDEDARAWLPIIACDALTAALTEAEVAFRKDHGAKTAAA